ncbi:MAG TPA: TIGR01777 family oxidoreductase [Acidimicrobiales bacterium]|nr:TIGR01777 family oxidoreductase [Acidimicrobiales bacterium]
MTFRHSARFDSPIGEVFSWHARPGAIHRLMPPWQPVKVAAESGALRDGTAVLAVPGGLKWVATHQPDGYVEGSQFVDVLTTPVLEQLVTWRHTHAFSASEDGGTVVTDTVETRVPGRLLSEMFGYRTRQLAGDLAAHQVLNPTGRRLTVAVSGSGGLIGSALCAFLSTGGHRVVRLVRGPTGGRGGAPGEARRWDPAAPDPDLLEGVDAVVHLAGESIAGRFTRDHKEAVRDSRIGPTRRLAEAAARAGVAVFASASAIGYYGPERGDEELTEGSGRGEGFLADLVADWEAATAPAAQGGARVVQVRTGIVQSPRGGALQLQRLLFETGLGGRLGDGHQWTPWIGIDDMVDVYLRAILDPALDGPVNAVAPGVVRNTEYARTLARVLRRPAVVPVPRFGPELLLGREGASEVAAASQRVVPAKLAEVGHRFRWAELEPALRHVLGRGRGRLESA